MRYDLDRLGGKLNQVIEKMNLLIREVEVLEQKSVLEQRKEILASMYTGMSNYTNLIVLAGYAGLFSLWGFGKGYLGSMSKIWIIISLLLSLAFFVGAEVFKMIYHAIYLRKISKNLNEGQYDTRAEIDTFTRAQQEFDLQNARFWPYFLIPTITFGLLAFGLLLYQLIYALVQI